MSSRPFIDIHFGRYLPDFGGMPNPEEPGYLVDAIGVRLTPNGYRGTPSFADVTSGTAASSASGVGIAAGFASATTRNFFFIDNAGAVAESIDDGVTWSTETPAGTALDTTGSFFQYGSDAVYACQTRAPVRKALNTGVANFAALGGSPPTASCGARVRQHAVLGCLVGVDNYAVQWSAIDNHQDWPTPGTSDAITKESGRQSLGSDCGVVRQILGGEKLGIVLQEEGLTRMTYQGGDEVYAFDTYCRGVGYGKRIGTRWVTDGTLWYGYNDSGMFATDGYSVNSISEGALDESIFNSLISHPNQSSLGFSISAYDPHRKLVLFGSLGAAYQLAYNVRNRSFSWMNEANIRCLHDGVTSVSLTGTSSGRTVFNINDSNRKLQRLSGNTATLALQTGYIEIDPGYTVQITGAHLLGAGVPSGLTLAYKSTSSLGSVDVSQSGFTSLTAPTRGMKATGRSTEQFHAFRVTGSGTEAQLIRGIRVYFERTATSP